MTEREQFAKDNAMSMDFVDWFFDHKKDGCGNVWFMMAAAMWEGWKGLASQEPKPLQVTDGMALDFHHALTDGSIGNDELEEIKVGLRAALCNVTELPVTALPDIATLRVAFERSEQESDNGTALKKSGLGYADKSVQSRWEQWLSCRAAMLPLSGTASGAPAAQDNSKQLCPDAWEQLTDLIDSPVAPTDALKQLMSRPRHTS
ncbi:TPA: hypothetical protein SMO99_003004 [Proteus mirabilis]|uniref:Uncharacterized protein n=2 Tax=Morganellaceae TaxID=1903414 RepID=A0AAI9HV07_MORMO|nr:MULTISPECIES: hypothetical protein [Providencia]EJV1664323.1 hypothetical protein [Klebsiella pneumoniae]EKW8762777.1 hypothetical protein [Morganella morganii]HEJ9424964.1 hypothetical protein [Proteus mirabilis]ELI9034668.1 hypothetical protein [Morganella morganii]ELR5252304.1 hypothetical protein [Providencia rettgeri]